MQTPFEKIIALFPERSLVIRSGSDTRYIVLKTWHQLMAASIAGLFFVWSTTASVGFSWNYNARLVVEAELAKTVATNQAFIAQLENDQKNAYELRQAFNNEVRKNEEWVSRFDSIRGLSDEVLKRSPRKILLRSYPGLRTSSTPESVRSSSRTPI